MSNWTTAAPPAGGAAIRDRAGSAADRGAPPAREPGPRGRTAQEAYDDAVTIRRSLDRPHLFAEIFDRYFAEIHGYLARRLGTGLADDLASETFLVAFRVRARFDAGRGNARAWLYGIATDLAGRHRRHEACRHRALGRPGPHREGRGGPAAGHPARALGAALAGLPRGDRDVLLLVALAGLTCEEVAESLGIRYGTVRSRLDRARGRVRDALGGAGPVRPYPEPADDEEQRPCTSSR